MRCFFRPHPRIQFDNSVVDPHTGEVTYPPSMTKQEFAKECDINNILKQFSTTGIMTHISAKASLGVYQDLPDQIDFQESLATVAHAQGSFASLPSKVRDRFHNDPAAFLEFMSKPENRPEMENLGLLPRSRPPAAPAPEPAPEPPVPVNPEK